MWWGIIRKKTSAGSHPAEVFFYLFVLSMLVDKRIRRFVTPVCLLR